jgi:hypothetical protein
MAHPFDRLAAGLRSAVAALVWLTPAVLLGLVLEALVGGSWIAYLALLLAGIGIGAWLEKARAAIGAAASARPAVPGDHSSSPPASDGEDDHADQKYLM